MEKQRHLLSKHQRVRSRKLIEQLFAKGKGFTRYPFRVFFLETSLPVAIQAGFGVSSKNFRRAVDRNHIKRQIREAWRLNKWMLEERMEGQPWQWAVFFLYTGKEISESSQVSVKMQTIIKKLIVLADERSASPA